MIWALMRLRLRESPAIVFSAVAVLTAVAFPRLGPFLAFPMIIGAPQFFSRRSFALESSLPVRGRDIVLAHMMAGLILMLTPMVVWAIAVRLEHVTEWSPTMMWLGAAAIALVVMIPFAIRTGQVAPLSKPVAIAASAPVVAATVLIVWKGWYFNGAVLLTLAAAGVFAAGSGAPAAPQLAAGGESTPLSRAAAASGGKARPWWWPLILTAPSFPALWGIASFLGGMSGSAQIYYFAMAVIGGGTMMMRARIRWLSALPVSTRMRLVVCYAPMTVAVLGGRFAGELVARHVTSLSHDYIGRGAPNTPRVDDFWNNRTNLALEYWEPGVAPSSTIIIAPWGETVAADTITILGLGFHNPFTTRKTSSTRFVEWQFGRASAEVYGRALSTTEYDDHAEHPRRLTQYGVAGIVGWIGLTALFLTLLVAAELVRDYRLMKGKRGQWIASLGGILPLFLVMGVDMHSDFRHHTAVFIPLGRWAVRYVQRTSPNMLWLAAIAGVVLIFLMFMTLERLFRNAEATEKLPASFMGGA